MNEESIFAAAIAMPDSTNRAAFLDDACGGHFELRRDVEALIAAHDNAGSFLQAPSAARTATLELPPPVEQSGLVIADRYKLLEQIGEGGMGTVWMAQQTEPIRRLVAVKLIKPGMDSKQVLARFEAERQALAIMDHPNIAKVFDGGATPSGRPYFVMELVKGVPITDFCDENQLTPRQRLELFLSVCHAVQHAHQKGIIHRDLKPSNILVVIHDTTPVVKVIDFGVAKALGQELTEKTLFTGFAQMVGTPLYMSPEQAGQSGLDIDTRSDIYSLGVLLYELLTGMTPFDKERFSKAAYEEIRRIIREEDPPKPSTRLSQATETLTSVSAHRQTEPAKLSKLVRGELDWIVMKALEKDRTRRYETANGFAQDIQRYLADDAVQACPPTAGYRLRKFARRNKRAMATASLLSAMVLVAVSALAVSYFRTSWALADVTQAVQDRQLALDREKQAKEDLELTAYIQRVELAGREQAVGNYGHAEQLLEECPEHLRGWEWRFLKRQRYGGQTPMQHSATVGRVAFSPDGQQVASVWTNGDVAIRDARTGRVLHVLEPRPAPDGMDHLVRSLVYSRNGRYLAAARHGGVIHVWDPTTGKLLHTLKGHKGACWQVAFSPDGQTLASGGEDRSLRLWDMASGKEFHKFPNPGVVKGVAFRPDGESVIAASDDGTVTVWNLGTRQVIYSFQGRELTYPLSAWFSPDSQRLAWASLDGHIKIWNTTTGQPEIDKQSNLHQCRAVCFHPDGKRIALAGFDGTLRIWDAVTGREMLTIFAHRLIVADAVFNHDGTKLATGSYDHTLCIWDATPLEDDPLGGQCISLPGHDRLVTNVAFSPDSRWLASSSWDGTAKVWEALRDGDAPQSGYALRYTLRGHTGPVSRVAFAFDNRTLVSGSWDKTVRFWDLEAPVGDSLPEFRKIPCAERVTGLALSPDGRLLAIGQLNRIAFYDPATGNEVARSNPAPAGVPDLAFTADSRHLASAGASDPAIRFWDSRGEKPLFEIRHDMMASSSVAVSPDGRLVASPGREQSTLDPTAQIWEVDWDAKTSKTPPLHILRGHLGYVWKVTFSTDGRFLATGSWDSTVKVWDVKTGKELATLRGHAGIVYTLAFSPDGRHLATGSGSDSHGEVKVWDAALWDEKLRKGH